MCNALGLEIRKKQQRPSDLDLSLRSLLPSGLPSGSDGKESACSAGDPSSIPGLGRSPGEENS